jgi:hypothetical protein
MEETYNYFNKNLDKALKDITLSKMLTNFVAKII